MIVRQTGTRPDNAQSEEQGEMMTVKWTVEYVPVSPPAKSKIGWKFPYNGDEWPDKDDWFWVWACKPGESPDSLFLLPKVAWWDGKQQRFLALGDKTVFAWRKAVPAK
jgi:hypothetical protein